MNSLNRMRAFMILPTLATIILLTSCTEMNREPNKEAMFIKSECGDILERWLTKPNQLEFLDCTAVDAPQVRFSARYRVAGNQADSVEDFLHKNYGMNKLQFLCCGWEPRDGVRGSAMLPDHNVSMTMHSEETLIHERTHWSDIPYFYIVVEEQINI